MHRGEEFILGGVSKVVLVDFKTVYLAVSARDFRPSAHDSGSPCVAEVAVGAGVPDHISLTRRDPANHKSARRCGGVTSCSLLWVG